MSIKAKRHETTRKIIIKSGITEGIKIPKKSIGMEGEKVFTYNINPISERIDIIKYGANLFLSFMSLD